MGSESTAGPAASGHKLEKIMTEIIETPGRGKSKMTTYTIPQKMSGTGNIHDIALMYAVQRGHGDVITALIRAGADFDARNWNFYDSTALMLAAWCGRADAVSALIQVGADLDARDANGRTALIIAVGMGYTDVASALIRAGADLGCVDNEGCDAEALAVKYGNRQILDLLRTARSQRALDEVPDAPRA